LKKGWGENRWRRIARFRLGGTRQKREDTGRRKIRKFADCMGEKKRHGSTYGRGAEIGRRGRNLARGGKLGIRKGE